MYRVVKKVSWEMGHRLVCGYIGKCANLHGHNYTADFELTTKCLDVTGFVMDMGTIGSAMKTWVNDNLDHVMMLQQDDTEVIRFCETQGFKTFVVEENPTAEVMSHLLWDVADSFVQTLTGGFGITVTKVTVWETGSSYAEYTPIFND